MSYTRPWIGVDLDSTLAYYKGWAGELHIGAPIPTMVKRVQAWLDRGVVVKVFTARVADDEVTNADGSKHDVAAVRRAIEAWCFEHIGEVLPITNKKDFRMIELWDDRAVQVIPNTGERADGKTA